MSEQQEDSMHVAACAFSSGEKSQRKWRLGGYFL